MSRYCVEERSVNLVFGQAGAQVPQALRRIFLHFGLTENPVPVTWRGEKKRGNRQEKSKKHTEGEFSVKPTAADFNDLPLKKMNLPSSLS